MRDRGDRPPLLSRRAFVMGAAAAAILPRLVVPGLLRAAAPPPSSTLAAAQGPDPRAVTAEAVRLLGGMEAFVRPGNKVVVKPNIGWDRRVEMGANTHPQVVRALCEMCLAAGAASVLIFDRTCNDARRCYVTSGIEEMVGRLGDPRVRLEFVNEDRYRTVEIPRGIILKKWPIYEPALEADVLINVPVAKHHGISTLTLGMKNLMGVMGGNRGSLHGEIAQKLADVATVVRPALNVLDATRVLVRNGPTGGSLADVKVLDRVGASTDIVALDSWGATLFGRRGEEIASVSAGARMGLGEMDLTRVRLLGEDRLKRLSLASRWLFGAFFLWLLWGTRYAGQDLISTPVNAFFRIDPLAGLSAMAAARAPIPFFWPLLLVIPFTLLFGRLFCGWICPLGGTLDLVGRKSRVAAPAPGGMLYPAKDALLVFCLAGSLFSLNLAGVLDPLSLLIRTLAMGVLPPLEAAARGAFTLGWSLGGPVRAAVEPVERFFHSAHLLSFAAPVFSHSLLFLALGAALLYAESRERRFWCRNLCPAGALFGCLGARAPFAPKVDKERCVSCGACARVCPMGACSPAPAPAQGPPGPAYRIGRKDCTGCGKCLPACPQGCISFGPARLGAGKEAVLSLARRQFLASAAAGAVVPLGALALSREAALPTDFIRPPGAVAEGEFLGRCLRCGECMRACLTNGLQPAGLEAGWEGMWTPRLVPRRGYCEYSCTLCGQVCPTDAIRPLHPVEKRRTVIGIAVFDRDLCIPYARGEECMVCEEHCPTPAKAIVFDDATVTGPAGPVRVKLPRVVRDLCIGCGICETRCPLQGASAIRVVRDGEDRAKP